MTLRLEVLILFAVIAPCLSAQGVWLSKRDQQQAELQVAEAFERARTAAGLASLKRTAHTRMEAQTVCTAAVSGQEPWGDFPTFVTADLHQQTAELIAAAIGKPMPHLENGRSSTPLDEADFPRFSVTVALDRRSQPAHPMYRVGVSRRLSRRGELLDRFSLYDKYDWKAHVVRECKNAR